MEIDARQQRGLAIVKDKRAAIREVVAGKYVVPSATRAAGVYFVDTLVGLCTCPDHEDARSKDLPRKCKHLWAAILLSTEGRDGSPVASNDTKRARDPNGPKFPNRRLNLDWRSYYEARNDEPFRLPALLRALCNQIGQPTYCGNGRPRERMSDVVFALGYAMYKETPLRFCAEPFKFARDRKWLPERVPAASTLYAYLDSPDLTPLLQVMIREAAEPLIVLETERRYAVDATGFSTTRYGLWRENKYNTKERVSRIFVKAHAVVGTQTHGVVWVTPTQGFVADTKEFEELFLRATERAKIDVILGDAGYLDKSNIKVAEAYGAASYFDLKINTNGSSSPEIARLVHRFKSDPELWDANYSRRGQVETVFSMIKTVFGERICGENEATVFNTMLLRFLLHNLRCVCHAVHYAGLEPSFDRYFGLAMKEAS